MPIDLKNLTIRGNIRFSCGDSSFAVKLGEDRWIADFPSFGSLLHVRKEASDLASQIKNLPALPKLPGASESPATTLPPEFLLWVTVKERPVGKLHFEADSVKFRPTPLSFLTKNF